MAGQIRMAGRIWQIWSEGTTGLVVRLALGRSLSSQVWAYIIPKLFPTIITGYIITES